MLTIAEQSDMVMVRLRDMQIMQMNCEAELAALEGAVRHVVADILVGPSSPC